MQRILIATANPGKFQEFKAEFNDLPFSFSSLRDVRLNGVDLAEPYDTLEANALYKARFFAKKSGLLTIAEDSGLFIPSWGGKPGVLSKRIATTSEGRIKQTLLALKGKTGKQRAAFFETVACIYNPTDNSYANFTGRLQGEIASKAMQGARKGMEYDAIFYYPPFRKSIVNLSVEEKNTISHRGKAIHQLKLYLQDRHSFKQIFIPLGLIVRKRRLFLNKRRDQLPKLNNKWEFPGGGVNNGELPLVALKRELREETGFTVKVEKIIPEIFTAPSIYFPGRAQLFFSCYICTVTKGKLQLPPAESAGGGWFTLKEALNLDLLAMNKKCIQRHFKLLSTYID